MMRLIKIFCIGLLLTVVSCSSTEEERVPEDEKHERIQRDYIVRDASSPYRPGWIEDAEIWAREHGYDIEKNRYFSYETEAKVSREISCSLAKANTTASVAREISTFISQTISSTTSGDASIDQNNPDIQRLNRYVRRDLTEKVQNMVYGAKVLKTYWEKRQYKKDKGAARDFTGWVCAAFIEMESSQLEDAIEKAAKDISSQVQDSSVKEKVENSLQDIGKKFQQSRIKDLKT